MTTKEFIDNIQNFKVDVKKVSFIEKMYGADLPEVVKLIISNCDATIFIDNDIRVLSFPEITEAEKDLHVDFKSKNIIPIFDCGNNDFIVYNYKRNKWSKFNIIDEVLFKIKDRLEDLLK